MIPVVWRTIGYAEQGNQFGYRNAALATRAALAPYTIETPDAPLALQYCTPDAAAPFPGRRNVLFTMTETPDIEREHIARLQAFDTLIVPSPFCVRIFRQWFRGPIHMVPLGVTPIPTVRRSFAAPFRWLWLSAFNLRKGFQTLATAWDRHFARSPNLELTVKTTELAPGEEGTCERRGNVTLDTRVIPYDALVQLYQESHAYVFPTLGEGFGLTLAEAMSSGLPCIATEYGGHLVFATKRNCRLLPARIKRLDPRKGRESTAADGKFAFATLNPDRLAEAMVAVMTNYDQALVMGARAAEDVRAFTWERTGARIAALLRHELKRAA